MKVVLTIAGSDSSGGAGVQADLKTFEAFGVFGASAITVLTAQNTTGVSAIHPLSAQFIKEQIGAVLKDFDVSAIKIGMLFSKEIIEAVEEIIKDLHMPIVIDPVFISKVGSPLLQEDAIEALQRLCKYASVVTPNRYEAYRLYGYEFGDTLSLEKLRNSSVPVVVKHQLLELPNKKVSVDQLFIQGERRVFQEPFVESRNLHGTGCSFSSAIAANLALDKSLEESIGIAKRFVTSAIESAPHIGHGAGPINHKQGGLSV